MPVLSIRECAKRLGVDRSLIYHRIAEKKFIPPVAIRRGKGRPTLMFDEQQFDQWAAHYRAGGEIVAHLVPLWIEILETRFGYRVEKACRRADKTIPDTRTKEP